MKKIVFVLICFVSAFALIAQTNSEDLNLDAANPELIGNESAEQKLKEVSVEKFENEGTWTVAMSADEGIITGRLFNGSPAAKKPIPAEEGKDIPDEKVFGAKVEYFRRGHNTFFVSAVKPLPVEGITKTVSVWVVGRNYKHTLKLIVEDFWGKQFELYMGTLNHSGWKQMTVAIPPQNPSGKHGIIQKDYHYGNKMGLKIIGFKIECDPDDAYGSYFIYFDDLRAVTDLYEIEVRDEDDMFDNW